MYYRHELDYTYPERSDQHMLELKRTRKFELDASYDYMPRGAYFKIKRALVASILHLVVFPIMHLTHGLKIHGRKNLKKHKDELKNGAITISNHVFMWDYLCVLKAIRPHISYFPLAGDTIAANHYTKLSVNADACLQCGHCESRCPFSVKQETRMREIAEYFKS